MNAGPFNRVGQFIFLLNIMEYPVLYVRQQHILRFQIFSSFSSLSASVNQEFCKRAELCKQTLVRLKGGAGRQI